jgi:hypothetical protein
MMLIITALTVNDTNNPQPLYSSGDSWGWKRTGTASIAYVCDRNEYDRRASYAGTVVRD